MDKDKFSVNKQKKIDRKLKRLQFVIRKQMGIDFCSFPTENLAICNAGLVNGLTKEILYEHFSKHGTIIHLRLLPGRSCCTVSYSTVEAAENAYNCFNGQLNIAQDNKPIYLLYVSKLPELEDYEIWGQLPHGLLLLKDFITQNEEEHLLQLFNFENQVVGKMKHRLVKHFGFEFRYDINNVDKDKPLEKNIPSECDFLWKRLSVAKPEFGNFQPDQLTINHYSPGQGIPLHVDTHSAFQDPIVCVSLGSAIVMEFKNQQKHISVLLPQRSMLIMSGESRYAWNHGIVPRKFDAIKDDASGAYSCLKRSTRVSFTFRKILHGDCKCSYPEKCDFLKKDCNMENNVAARLEKLHVHQVYQNIADHFSDTRHKPWPNVLKFVQSLDFGSILVDVGCGNGKYLGKNHLYEIGFDYSAGLINICKSRGYEVSVGDCLKIPLREGIADGVLSIAVIHHLGNEVRRLEAIKEIVRILKIGGRALIYVWAQDQMKDKEKSSYMKQDRKNRKSGVCGNNKSSNTEVVDILDGLVSFPVHTNRSQFQAQDVLVPWKLKDENKSTFLRFYHVFEHKELEQLCSNLLNVKIIKSYYDQGNVCAILEKTL